MSIFPRYRIILATCLLSLCASLAQAGFVKVDDFDSYSPGDIVGQSNSPWSGTSAMGNVAADPTDVSNQVLAIETDSGVLRRPMTIPSNEAHMMFFRFRIESQPKYSFGMAPSATPSEFSDFGPEISVANNTGTGTNDLRVHDGTYVDVLTINQNTWYNAWVMVDNITDEFQMWVNDTPGGNADITTDRLYHDSDGDFDFRMAAVDALAVSISRRQVEIAKTGRFISTTSISTWTTKRSI